MLNISLGEIQGVVAENDVSGTMTILNYPGGRIQFESGHMNETIKCDKIAFI